MQQTLKNCLISCKADIIDSVNPTKILPFLHGVFTQDQIFHTNAQQNRSKAAEALFNTLTNRLTKESFLAFVDALAANKHKALVKQLENTLLAGRIH